MTKAPTMALSMRNLRREGWFCWPCESWEPFVFQPDRKAALLAAGKPIHRKADLLGLADILAVHPERRRPLLIQTTAVSVLAPHRNKMLALSVAQPKEIDERQTPLSTLWLWLRSGGDFEMHGWAQDGAAGSRWLARREQAFFQEEDLVEYIARTPVGTGWIYFREPAGTCRSWEDRRTRQIPLTLRTKKAAAAETPAPVDGPLFEEAQRA